MHRSAKHNRSFATGRGKNGASEVAMQENKLSGMLSISNFQLGSTRNTIDEDSAFTKDDGEKSVAGDELATINITDEELRKSNLDDASMSVSGNMSLASRLLASGTDLIKQAVNRSSSNTQKDTPLIRVGCVGGGLFGRLMALEANRLGISMTFLDPAGADCPAASVVGGISASATAATSPASSVSSACSGIIEGELDDEEKIAELANLCDVVTVESEANVGVDPLASLEEGESGAAVMPGSRVVLITKDKFVQKEYFRAHGVSLAPFISTPNVQAIQDAVATLGLPLMLKKRKSFGAEGVSSGGENGGKSRAIVKDSSQKALHAILKSLDIDAKKRNAPPFDLYAEGIVDFQSEIVVLVVRSKSGQTVTYPPALVVRSNGTRRLVLAPASRVSQAVRDECERVAWRAVDCLGVGATGVFGVELWLVPNDEAEQAGGIDIILNEVKPRPHSSAQFTQSATVTSQYENHLRAICDLPLGDTRMTAGASATIYLLGSPKSKDAHEETMRRVRKALSMPRAVLHWYGKGPENAGPDDLLAHVTVTADCYGELESSIAEIVALENIDPNVIPRGIGKSPIVGVVAGAESDLVVMEAALQILKTFDVPYEVNVMSASRSPEKVVAYADEASGRGIRVLIAGSGSAAFLPGMLASMTTVPVVDVPFRSANCPSSMEHESPFDAYQSTSVRVVKQQRSRPVAAVAMSNATKAGILALRILSSTSPELRKTIEEFHLDMKFLSDEEALPTLEQFDHFGSSQRSASDPRRIIERRNTTKDGL